MRLLYVVVLVMLLSACGNNAENTSTEPEVAKAQTTPQEDIEAKLEKMGITLPEASKPVANYVNAVRTGNLVFMAGKGPKMENGEYIKGKVGADLTEEEGYKAARRVGILQLAALKAEIGDLDKVKRLAFLVWQPIDLGLILWDKHNVSESRAHLLALMLATVLLILAFHKYPSRNWW